MTITDPAVLAGIAGIITAFGGAVATIIWACRRKT